MKKELRLKVYSKCNNRCAYCGIPIEYKDMQVDHIHPQNKGGTDDIENLHPSCRKCNNYKHSFDLETFRKELGYQLERCQKNTNFRLAKMYGQIQETPKPIIFYFEQ